MRHTWVVNAAISHYRRVLRDQLQARLDRNPRYSIRAFARSLGTDSGALAQILAGTRIPSEKAAKKVIAKLDLSPEETEAFLRSLAEVHAARALKRQNPFFRRLLADAIGPSGSKKDSSLLVYRELEHDYFRMVADWYHYAILELTLTADFQSNPRWIAQQLGITVTEVNQACERLRELGYLGEQDGRWVKTTLPLMTMDRTRSSTAHRKRQRQILDKALVALEEVPIESRNHSAMTMAIDPEKIPEAKVLIQKFLDELSVVLESGKPRVVYEASVCLFPLQILPLQTLSPNSKAAQEYR